MHILKNSEKAAGQERIYIHSEKEFEKYEHQKEEALILNEAEEELKSIGEELEITADF